MVEQTPRYIRHIDPTTPSVVLVRPQLGENIGSAARAAMNFGLSDLRIVNPRDGWPNAKAHEMSAKADWIIENAKLFDTLEEAIADCHITLAATARRRDLVLPSHTPEEGGKLLASSRVAGEKTAYVFGPENNGLSNDEIALCNGIVTAATHPSNPSLNLAQGVMIMTYSWFTASEQVTHLESEPDYNKELATQKDVEGLYNHFNDELEARGYYRTEAIKPVIQKNFRALLSRANMTAQEVRTLRGMVRFLIR